MSIRNALRLAGWRPSATAPTTGVSAAADTGPAFALGGWVIAVLSLLTAFTLSLVAGPESESWGLAGGLILGGVLAGWFCRTVAVTQPTGVPGSSWRRDQAATPPSPSVATSSDTRVARRLVMDGDAPEKELSVVPRPHTGLLPEDERREAADRIRALIADDALHMVLQPIFDTRSGELIGAEAFARFTTESGEGPDYWFRQAAIAGLGVELERAALRKALELRYEVPHGAFLAVNVSAATLLNRGLLYDLEDVSPGRLVLELTEHSPVDDYQKLYAAVVKLRNRGHILAVDDAGSASATLRHIVRLNPQILKLDVTLTAKLHIDPVRYSLISMLLDFANRNGMRVVAEGVETQEELNALKELEVHAVQGYYLARPAEPPLVKEAPTLRRMSRSSWNFGE